MWRCTNRHLRKSNCSTPYLYEELLKPIFREIIISVFRKISTIAIVGFTIKYSSKTISIRRFSAGSFRDMTRVARLDEDMWTELCMADADYLTHELDILIENLTAYADALKHSDNVKLRALLKEGRELKASAGGN